MSQLDQHVLRPLYLIPQYSVTLNDNNTRIQHPAMVEYTKATDSYEISINQNIAQKMYEQTALKAYITYEDLLAGLLFHEVFHIKYKSFSVPYAVDTEFFKFVHNVVCDNQIEWHGTRDHPEAAKFIRLMLTALRKDVDLTVLKKTPNMTKQANIEKLEKMKDTFFYLVRFGVIIQNSDAEFVQFLMPLILSGMRNEPDNLMLACHAIYEYFNYHAKQWDLNLSQIGVKTRAVTMRELKTIDKAIGEGQQVISSSLKKTIEALKNQVPMSKMTTQSAQGAGYEKTRIQINEKDTQFYRETVRKYESKIRQIRSAFKRRLDQVSPVASYDGDFNWRRQQQAYIDSFSLSDEGKNYQIYKRNRISMHNLILRDVSSSTSLYKVQYAELTVCLHAALQNLPGLIDGHIDFHRTAIKVMDFGQSIREAALYPYAYGGTDFGSAFEIALGMKLSGAKKNIINLITDGDSVGGYEEAEQALLNRGIKIWMWDVSEYEHSNPKLRKTSFSTFHLDIAKALMNEL